MDRVRRWGIALSVAALAAGGCAAPSPPGPPAAGPPASAQAGGQTIVAIQPAGPPPQTLPQWLGINDLCAGIGGLHQFKMQLIAMFFPQLQSALAVLEPPPPILPITDPANLKDDAPPVVQAAAEAQAEQDTEAQKVKAIEALGRIGCVKGMPAVEDGLSAALDDQNRYVRRAAVKAISGLAGSPCNVCKGGACCTPKIYKRLHRMAYKESSPGCFEEIDPTNRRLARLALQNCQPRPPEQAGPPPIEGPGRNSEPPLPKPEGPSKQPEAPPAPGIAKTKAAQKSSDDGSPRLAPPTPAVEKSNGVVQAKGESGADLSKETGPGVAWESVLAPFDKFQSRTQAWAAMVYFRKRAMRIQAPPPPGFARSKLTVQSRRWTAWSDLKSTGLQSVLTSLPVGSISPVIEGKDGYRIIRILKRTSKIEPTPDVIPASAKQSPEDIDRQIREATQTILSNQKPRKSDVKVAPVPPTENDSIGGMSSSHGESPTNRQPVKRDTMPIKPLPETKPPVEPHKIEPPISNDKPWDLDAARRRRRSSKRGNVMITGTNRNDRTGVRPVAYEEPAKVSKPQKSVRQPAKFQPPRGDIKRVNRPKPSSVSPFPSKLNSAQPETRADAKTQASKVSPKKHRPTKSVKKPTKKKPKSWLDDDFGSWSSKKAK